MSEDSSVMTPGQKAAHTRKWREAQRRAQQTARNAKTFAKYELTKRGYRCLALDTPKGYEYKGIVDLVAVKRDNRNPDNLRVLLVQVKGGSARVSEQELTRLQDAVKRLEVDWNAVEKPGTTVRFRKPVA